MATLPEDIEAPLLKAPPHSLDAERSVLGGLMLDNSAWERIEAQLAAEDFYRADHRTIFRCIQELVGQNSPLDIVTIAEALTGMGELENVGGMAYLSSLADATPTASNIQAYAQIVRERAIVRALISVGQEIAESGFNPGGRDSATLLDQAEAKVFQIADARVGPGGPEAITQLAAKATERIEQLYATKGALTGLGTGFKELDKLTAGLQPADLVVVAGRPSMGKTSLMMNMAEAAAIRGEKPVLVFSMEMPAQSLVMRMISSLGSIDQGRIRTGQLKDGDWYKLTTAVSMLNQKPLYIDDTATLTPQDIRSRARRLAREKGPLGMILVDYLQLMQASGAMENRVSEISEISRSLKSIAKEFNCPLVAGSQLNRSLEQRSDKRPIMSDLRESGAIEQDADVILSIYRDEVYNKDSQYQGVAEVSILKQRNGPTGWVKLAFIGRHTKFENFTDVYSEEDLH